ncbi:MAG: thioesterase family protein [Gammaproteobacteria bacterium]|nr:thioesterase family protein [Gammaproteobacteria bacterium]MDH3466324.1 thioesterase family protein [Gammaproteobacteria bacterium]
MNNHIETFRAVVYPWHCDHQGHMTTMHYVGMFDAAFWHHVSAMRFTRAYLAQHQTGFVDLKDTLEYKAELPVGSLVVIVSEITRIGKSSITALHTMRNAETNEIAATSEKISAYFDLRARHSTPIPEDIAIPMRAMITSATGQD